MTYVVTIRGPVPPDLGRKLAEAHAAAIRARAKHQDGQLQPQTDDQKTAT